MTRGCHRVSRVLVRSEVETGPICDPRLGLRAVDDHERRVGVLVICCVTYPQPISTRRLSSLEVSSSSGEMSGIVSPNPVAKMAAGS